METPDDRTSKWSVLGAIMLGVFMAMVDSSIVNIALPQLVDALGADLLGVQWVVLSYMLAVTCLILLAGRLADMYSKRRLYAVGFAVFTLGSLLCGLASGLGFLVAARVLQGIGAAFIMALGPAILVEHFPPPERGRAIGLVGSTVSLGIIVGPTLGGILLVSMGWRSIFLVNIPLGVVGTVLVLRLLKQEAPKAVQSFDFAGALSLSFGILCALLAITLGQKGMFGEHGGLLLGVIAIVLMSIFVRVELRAKHPVLDLRIFANGSFSLSLSASFLNFVALAGTVLLMPFYLQTIAGYDPQTAGFLLAAMPIALGVTAPVGGWLSDRYGCQPVSLSGLLLTLVGFGLIADLGAEVAPLEYILRFLPLGVGLGLFQSPNNNAILSAAPRDRVGVASGVLAVARTLGQTLGTALLGAGWAWRQTVAAARGGTAADVQMTALREILMVTVALTLVCLVFVVAALLRERQKRSVVLSPG